MSAAIDPVRSFPGLQNFIKMVDKYEIPDDYEIKVTVGFMRTLAAAVSRTETSE